MSSGLAWTKQGVGGRIGDHANAVHARRCRGVAARKSAAGEPAAKTTLAAFAAEAAEVLSRGRLGAVEGLVKNFGGINRVGMLEANDLEIARRSRIGG